MNRHALVALGFLLPAAGLPAQQTWVVSPPASNLISAFANAKDGDTIVVNSALYDVGNGIVTTKALTVVGKPGARIVGTGNSSALAITNIPTGRRFVMRGMWVSQDAYVFGPTVEFKNNAGSVFLSGCQFTSACSAYSCPRYISVEGCSLFAMTNCSVSNLTVECQGSVAMFTGCALAGRIARDHALSSGRAATSALWVYSGSVTLAKCTASGGAGEGKYAGVPAVALFQAGALSIAGDAADTYTAGAPGSTATSRVSSIEAFGVGLRIDPKITLVPNPGQPGIAGSAATSPRPISMAATSAAPGGTLSTTVIADAGEPVVLFGGLLRTPTAMPPFGDLFINQSALVLLASTIVGASEHWTVQVPIPNLASLSGFPIGFQAIAGGQRSPTQFSVPAAVVIE
ncbi:MAG: hypothetical protein H6837_11565 [Planctomycetes bacterium]|nr:hypothetical protein [Planctomycetota bacterium]